MPTLIDANVAGGFFCLFSVALLVRTATDKSLRNPLPDVDLHLPWCPCHGIFDRGKHDPRSITKQEEASSASKNVGRFTKLRPLLYRVTAWLPGAGFVRHRYAVSACNCLPYTNVRTEFTDREKAAERQRLREATIEDMNGFELKSISSIFSSRIKSRKKAA